MTKTLERNIHVEALSRGLGTPTLEGLAYALRHPETWPEGFVWDFNECDACAMGLAQALWGQKREGVENEWYVSQTARQMAMSYTAAQTIFLDADWAVAPKRFLGITYGQEAIDFDDITPDMVADQIDAYLAKEETR